MAVTYAEMDRSPKPNVGERVHLVLVEFTAYRYAKPTWVLDGTVIEPFWWESKDPRHFALLVDDYTNDPVPKRSLRMDKVVSVNGVLTHGWDEVVGERMKEWHVKGSRGDDYVVRLKGDTWTCMCRGFSFHRHCRHIDEVREGIHGKPTEVIVS